MFILQCYICYIAAKFQFDIVKNNWDMAVRTMEGHSHVEDEEKHVYGQKMGVLLVNSKALTQSRQYGNRSMDCVMRHDIISSLCH